MSEKGLGCVFLFYSFSTVTFATQSAMNGHGAYPFSFASGFAISPHRCRQGWAREFEGTEEVDMKSQTNAIVRPRRT
jgi:hypothetical protein